MSASADTRHTNATCADLRTAESVASSAPIIAMVACYFPPDAEVGAVRPASVASALVAAGYRVAVVAATRDSSGNLPATEVSGVAVIRVREGRSLRDYAVSAARGLRRVTRRTRRPPHTPAEREINRETSSAAIAGYASRGRHGMLRRWLVSMVRLPDDHQGFIFAARRAISRVCDERCAAIYCSAPPFSALIAARLASRACSCPLVVELRDPWIDSLPWRAHRRSKLSDIVETRLERWCLSGVSRVLVSTSAAAERLRRRYPSMSQDWITVVMNGIPDEMLDRSDPMPQSDRPPQASRARGHSLAHFGTLYLERDPRAVFDALGLLRDAESGPVTLTLFTGVNSYRGVLIAELAREYGVSDLVHMHPPVARRDAWRRMRDFDALLLLAQRQPLQVPQKAFEYLGAGTPIVALTEPDSATASVVMRFSERVAIARDDAVQVASAIGKAVKMPKSDQPGEDMRITTLRTSVQMRAVVESMQTVIGTRRLARA